MEVLKVNKMLLRFCGILWEDEGPKPFEKALKLFVNFLFSFGYLYCLVFSSAMYMYHNQNDVSGAMNALILFFGGLSMFGSYFGFVVNEYSIKSLHYELQNLVNGGE